MNSPLCIVYLEWQSYLKTIISQRDYKKSIQYLFQQVLTPIVSLELDDLPATRFFKEQRFPRFIFPHHRSKHQNQRDDVDFFFNENNNRGGTAKGGLIRQDSKDSIDNYFKVRKKSKKKSLIGVLIRAQLSQPLGSRTRIFSTQADQDQE